MSAKHLASVAALAALLCMASPCHADPMSGLYLGVDLGSSNAANVCDNQPAGATCTTTATALRVTVGYQINSYVALEAGFTDFGTDTASGTAYNYDPFGNLVAYPISGSAKASGFEIASILSAPMGENFSLLGKIGAASTRVAVDSATVGYSASATATTSTLAAGIGLQYAFTARSSFRLLYERYGRVGDSSTTGTSDLSAFTAGFIYTF